MTLARQTLEEQLGADLRAAMKARNTVAMATLRTMLSALDNATAVPVDTSYVPLQGITPDVARRELSQAEKLDILRREAAGQRSAAERYEQLGKVEEAARLRAELSVFTAYLGDLMP